MENVVTGAVPEPVTQWRRGRVVLGAALGVAGHAIALVGALIAGRSTDAGDGFDDLAAVAVTFFGVQALFLITVVVAGIVLVVRHRRDVAAGLLGGWALGAAFCALVISGVIPV
ncbi:hypothetical protein [Luedemannella helvata]|uniref:Uncharacterized protein n=1 Tax=Luedemannella helvata TaxID=349315 RepID=A0ABN2KL80_9ACTN